MSLRLARRLTAAAFFSLLVLAGRGLLPGVAGGLPSVGWWGLSLVDPLAALETALAARGATGELLIGAALLCLPWLLFGRVFCGWLCPLGLVLELNDDLRQRFRKWLPQGRLPRSWKYGLLVSALLGSALAAWPLFQSVSPINWLVWGAAVGAGSEWLLVAGAVAVDWLWRRSFCASLCPLGALHSLLGRWAPFRVRFAAAAGRPGCRRCSQACSLGIPVMERWSHSGAPALGDPECSRCGDCLRVCPAGRLKLGWGAPGGVTPPPSSTSFSTIGVETRQYEV